MVLLNPTASSGGDYTPESDLGKRIVTFTVNKSDGPRTIIEDARGGED